MNKRLNITLPEQTVKLIERIAGKGQRSRLIDHAVRRYVAEKGRANLRKELIKQYQQHAKLDLRVAEEWFAIDDEAWPESR